MLITRSPLRISLGGGRVPFDKAVCLAGSRGERSSSTKVGSSTLSCTRPIVYQECRSWGCSSEEVVVLFPRRRHGL